MFSSFTTLLHADAPALNRRRAYRLEIGRDLFDAWWVEVTFGRIGGAGRTLRFAARDDVEARDIAGACLARRGSAPRRIGVSYEERSTFDPQGWSADLRRSVSTRPRLRTSAAHVRSPLPSGSTEAPPQGAVAAPL